MRKRLLVALMCILMLPLFASLATPSTTALAGHTITGTLCTCGCEGCLCDPGEQPDCTNGLREEPADKQRPPSDRPRNEVDLAPLMPGLLALLLWLWLGRGFRA